MPCPTRRYGDVERRRFIDRPVKKRKLELLIGKFQARQKVFGDEYSVATILNLMNKFLWKVIREPLVGIYETDEVFGEFLCHVFFRRRTDIEDDEKKNNGEMWQNTKEPLYCLLVAAYVSNVMSLTYPEQEEFKQNHDYYEKKACSIFEQIYQENDEKLEYHVLAFDYESVYKKDLNMDEDGELLFGKRQTNKKKNWQKDSRELLCVAYRGQCMKFISHIACQTYIKIRWKYGTVGKLFGSERKQSIQQGFASTRGASNRAVSFLTKTKYGIRTILKSRLTRVLWTPRSKYFIHMFLNIVFIIFFAMALLKKPWRVDPKKTDEGWNSGSVAFYYVFVCLSLETAEQIWKTFYTLRKGYHKTYWWANYSVRFLRFALFGANCMSLCLAATFRIYSSLFFPVCEVLFTASFVVSTVTTLKYFFFFDYFGAKINLIKEMASSIFKYMAILLVFWFIYAVCYLSLTEGISVNQETPVWQFFQSGVFEILGEYRDEDRDGIIAACSNVSWDTVSFEQPDQDRVRCLFRSSLIPPLLFLYMMVASIMLINVFTAMLSHEYEISNQNAANYSRFHKYEILARFESKIFFPRPFNIIYIFGWIFYKLFSCLKCEYYVKCGCCTGLSDQFPFNIVISWFSSVRSWGSSPKDAKVNEEEVRNLLRKVLAKHGTNDFVDAVQKLITDWKQAHQNPESLDRIEEAHKILQGIIGNFKDFLSTETEGVRQRVGTLVEEMTRNNTPALTGEQIERVRNMSGALGRERTSTVI